MLVAASSGHGLVVDIDAAVAQTRSGKQILNARVMHARLHVVWSMAIWWRRLVSTPS